jgi:hypothetical protein
MQQLRNRLREKGVELDWPRVARRRRSSGCAAAESRPNSATFAAPNCPEWASRATRG